MSRCFPFPPPGYEKQISTDETDSLIKEKEKKEKKHKKEKKDKDKREKKDKDKHKEQKEKHRDRKDKEKRRTSEEKKPVGVLPNTGDREKFVRNAVQNNGNEESKFIQDLARRISNEEEARESQSVGKSSFPCGVAMEKRSENGVHRVSSCRDQKIMVQPVGKKKLQEKNHLRESVTKGDKSLGREEIKKSEPTHTSSQENKEEAINKSKPKYVQGVSRLRERDVDIRNFGKRKDHETNGFFYENGSRLHKIHRPVDSPVSSVENESKLQGTVCNGEVNELRINGFIDAQEHKSRPAISSVEVKEKRPHSDLKYLDQILNVPKGGEFDESEEQEWLFDETGVKLSNKPKKDSTTSLDETLQVWNQALRIESTDHVALPYVVPL